MFILVKTQKPLIKMKSIEVVAAIIQFENRYLCLQRGPAKFDYISKKFEFPGGKVEKGESQEQALVREIKEELEITLPQTLFFKTIEHQYPDFKITMHAFLCPVTSKSITRTEHIAEEWLNISQLHSLDWAAADIPLVDALIEQHIAKC